MSLKINSLRYFGIILVLFFASACTTVSSVRTDLAADGKQGISYYLPKQMVKVEITPSNMTLAEAKKKLSEASKAVETSESNVGITAKKIVESIERQRIAATQSEIVEHEKAIQTALKETLNKQFGAVKKAKSAQESAKTFLAAAKEAMGGCVYKFSAKLMDPIPDTSKRYVADLKHSPFRDDTAKFKITKHGLLSSSNVVADDRTGNILVSLAGSIGAVAPIPRGRFGVLGGDSKPSCADPRPIQKILEPEGSYDFSSSAPFKVSFSDDIGGTAFDSGNDSHNEEKALAKADGLYYRTTAPIEMRIEQMRPGGGWRSVYSNVLMVPQAGPTSYLPMRSSAFVKTVSDASFDNGMLTHWDSDRPSEVLEIVRLPADILKSLISVPSEILSLKVDYSSTAEALAAQQSALLEQQINNQVISACVTSAKDSDSALACFNE